MNDTAQSGAPGTPVDEKTRVALDIARRLAVAGVPIFLAEPGGDPVVGYQLPNDWQHTTPDPTVVDRWRPGMALCAVGGHEVDFIDVDPRNGGDQTEHVMRENGSWPRTFGTATTPSGGRHYVITPLRVGKYQGKGTLTGIDVQGGRPDGTGRGFVFLAPTVRRSKVTGEPTAYHWVETPDLDALTEWSAAGDDSGIMLADMIRGAQSATEDRPAPSSPADPFDPPPHIFTIEQARAWIGPKLDAFRAMRTPEDHGFNAALNDLACMYSHFIPVFVSREAAERTLYAAAEHNRSVEYQGERKVRATIRSGLDQQSDPWKAVLPPDRAAAGSQEGGDPAAPDQADPSESTWSPQDLSGLLDGTYEPEMPELFPRDDGPCLLYRGRVHSFHGESESGKSLLAQIESARVLRDTNESVLYVDFESDAATVVPRLLLMGAEPASIRERFRYVRPDAKPNDGPDQAAYGALLNGTYAVCVLDGVTDSMAMFGIKSNAQDEVAIWMKWLPARIARSTGAAVIMIDHVSKDPDRGRHALGSQHKMNGLDGAAYVIEVAQALGRGMRGAVRMRVGKDRPGAVRPECGAFEARDRTQEAAYVVIDSTGPSGQIKVEIRPPVSSDEELGALMQEISMVLEKAPGPLSFRRLKDVVTGKDEKIRHAANRLSEGGYIQIIVKGNTHTHLSVKSYRMTGSGSDADSNVDDGLSLKPIPQ